jgi:hypothetical protein
VLSDQLLSGQRRMDFLTEKMSLKSSTPLQATHLTNIDGAENSLLFGNHYIIKQ